MLSNNQQKLIRKLSTPRLRKKTDLFICEGKRSCLEAINNTPEVIEFAVVAESARCELPTTASFPIVTLPDNEFNEISVTSTPQGIMVVVKEPKVTPFNGKLADDYALVLDQVTDPGNFGSIVRCAWAAGLKEVWYTSGTTDPYGAKAVRSGMGAHFNMTFRKFDDLEAVEDVMTSLGGKLCLTKPLGTVSCFAPEFKFSGNAVVLGNEANGIQYSSSKAQEITIPMPGNAESLNVAMAATIVIFEQVRRNESQ